MGHFENLTLLNPEEMRFVSATAEQLDLAAQPKANQPGQSLDDLNNLLSSNINDFGANTNLLFNLARSLRNINQGKIGDIGESELEIDAPLPFFGQVEQPQPNRSLRFISDLIGSEEFKDLSARGKQSTFALAQQLAGNISTADKASLDVFDTLVNTRLKIKSKVKTTRAAAGGKPPSINVSQTTGFLQPIKSAQAFSPLINTMRALKFFGSSPNPKLQSVALAIQDAFESRAGNFMTRGFSKVVNALTGLQDPDVDQKLKDRVTKARDSGKPEELFDALLEMSGTSKDGLSNVQETLVNVMKGNLTPELGEASAESLARSLTDQVSRQLILNAFRLARALNGGRVSDADVRLAEAIVSINAGDFNGFLAQSENIAAGIKTEISTNRTPIRNLMRRNFEGASEILEDLDKALVDIDDRSIGLLPELKELLAPKK